MSMFRQRTCRCNWCSRLLGVTIEHIARYSKEINLILTSDWSLHPAGCISMKIVPGHDKGSALQAICTRRSKFILFTKLVLLFFFRIYLHSQIDLSNHLKYVRRKDDTLNYFLQLYIECTTRRSISFCWSFLLVLQPCCSLHLQPVFPTTRPPPSTPRVALPGRRAFASFSLCSISLLSCARAHLARLLTFRLSNNWIRVISTTADRETEEEAPVRVNESRRCFAFEIETSKRRRIYV